MLRTGKDLLVNLSSCPVKFTEEKEFSDESPCDGNEF